MGVAKLCIPYPPTDSWWTVNGGSFATAAQCTRQAASWVLNHERQDSISLSSHIDSAVIRTPSLRGSSLPMGHNGSTAPVGSYSGLGHQGLPKTSHDWQDYIIHLKNSPPWGRYWTFLLNLTICNPGFWDWEDNYHQWASTIISGALQLSWTATTSPDQQVPGCTLSVWAVFLNFLPLL